MSEPFEVAELLQAEWPVHGLGQILGALLEADMTVAEEQLTQRRLVKGSMVIEGEGGIPGGERLLTTVLRACLSFAGRKLAGARAGDDDAKATSSRAAAWCTCAVNVLLNAPEEAAISCETYEVFRTHFARFPHLGSATLATVERAIEKNDLGGNPARLLVALAVAAAGSRDGDVKRRAIGRLSAFIGNMSPDDITAWVDHLDGRSIDDLAEVCLAQPSELATRAMPAIARRWPAIRGDALVLAAHGVVGGCLPAWIDIFEVVARCWPSKDGALRAEEESAVVLVLESVGDLASSQSEMTAVRIARAATRIATVSCSLVCEAAVVNMCTGLLKRGVVEAGCALHAAAEIACGDASEALARCSIDFFDIGSSHQDDIVRCLAFELAGEVIDSSNAGLKETLLRVSSNAASAASHVAGEMLRLVSANTEEAGGPIAVLGIAPGALRLLLVDARDNPEIGADTFATMLDVVDGVQNLTRAGVEGKEEQFCTLRLSLEVMIDEAARFSASSLSLLRHINSKRSTSTELTDTTAYLTHLLDAHRTLIAASRSQIGNRCRLSLEGCVKLLDLGIGPAHIMHMSARCLLDLSIESRYPLSKQKHGSVLACAEHAAAAWLSRAPHEAAAALKLLRGCIVVASARGGMNFVRSLLLKVTNSSQRIHASQTVAKRVHPAMASNSFVAAGRAGKHSPMCSVAAMVCNAFDELLCRTSFDDEAAHESAAAMLDVIHVLAISSGAEASADAEFVLDACVIVVRDAIFHERMKPELAKKALEVVIDHYKRVDSLPVRVVSFSDVLVDASRHVTKGRLLLAPLCLLETLEADLAELASVDYAPDTGEAMSDAATALHKILTAVQVYFDTSGKATVSATPELPSLALLALQAARICLEWICKATPGSKEEAAVISSGAYLLRSVEVLMRCPIIPEPESDTLQRWHWDLFFRSAHMAARLSLDADGHPRAPVRGLETFVEKGKGGEYLEEVLRTRTALANKMSWADDWTDAPLSPGRRLKPKEDSGIVSDAKPLLNGDTPRKAQKLAATEARRRKKKRRKRDKNPFVEALKESEGGKGGSAKEYEDLEDFIVCKPGRDYRRLLGL